jgi:hypothetical protein
MQVLVEGLSRLIRANLIGRPIYLGVQLRSSTQTATTSQPRCLLSIARLKIARSRLHPAICSLVLMDHTWLGRTDEFALIPWRTAGGLGRQYYFVVLHGLSPSLRDRGNAVDASKYLIPRQLSAYIFHVLHGADQQQRSGVSLNNIRDLSDRRIALPPRP